MLVQTTTSEPLTTAYLIHSWGKLISEAPLEVVWKKIEWKGLGECGGAAADRHSTMMRDQVVGGDAGSNHYSRAQASRT